MLCWNSSCSMPEKAGNFMWFSAKRAHPYIVRRNRAMSHGTRMAIYRNTVPEGKKYEVLEKAHNGDWLVVTVLTIVEGRPKVAAA